MKLRHIILLLMTVAGATWLTIGLTERVRLRSPSGQAELPMIGSDLEPKIVVVKHLSPLTSDNQNLYVIEFENHTYLVLSTGYIYHCESCPCKSSKPEQEKKP